MASGVRDLPERLCPQEGTMSKILSKGLTFDDVLLVPAYSEVTPDMVDVTAWLTPSISLNIPLVSAAMDTVTESAMAISLARAGGIGIVHKNMSIERQKLEIEKVKKSESGMIIDPITVEPDDTVEHALELMHAYRVSGLPVVREKKLVGILTNRDVRFVEDLSGTKVRDVMTSENLITVPTGTTLEEAKHHLHTHRIEKLLVVDEKGELAGLLTMKDIDKVQKYPNACKDSKGRLRVGAAIGVGPEGEKRAAALIAAGVDVLVLDSAHGHSKNILDAVSAIKGAFPDCQLVAGNVATYAIEKAWQLGAKPVTCSDSTGWIYDPDGIDVATLIDVKQVRRARLTEYAKARPNSVYHEGKGVWTVKCDVALPCATQNELLLDDAKALVANGCFAVAEGANMPTSLDATAYLQEHGILFCPGKASNAGGVATSALEMTQNSERLSWTFEEVDAKLKTIMVNIFHNLDAAAKEYGMEGNYVAGANIAGFLKVADAMTAQGIV